MACRKWSVTFSFFFFEFVHVMSYEQTFGAVMQPLSGSLGGKLQRFPGCAGVLMAGMEARIVREDGTEADFNEAGELWLRGNNVSTGYWNNSKATSETFVDGWLHTGDRFKVDEKENFWCAF
jgi:acyl-CoA synthetase (AMP-forming)/AMP-acid ligase II